MTDARIHELISKGVDVYILSPQSKLDSHLIEVNNQSTRTRARKMFDGSLAGMLAALEQCVSEARPWDHDGPFEQKPAPAPAPAPTVDDDDENPFG